MVSLPLSTLLPPIFAAASNPSPTAPPLFAHQKKPLSPCSVLCSPRQRTKSLAFASVPPPSVSVDEEEAWSLERYLGDTTPLDFGRLNWDSDKKGCQIQSAIVGYEKRSSPSLRVDLVSHIYLKGKQYIATLQEELQQYDCVLYEMVASREDLEEGLETTSGSHGVKFGGFTFPYLGVLWETPTFNYKFPNWFRADIDWETLEKLQNEQTTSILDRIDWRSKFEYYSTHLTDEGLPNEEQYTSILDRFGLRSKLWAPRFLMGHSTTGTVCDQTSDYAELEALYRLDFVSAFLILFAKKFFRAYQFDGGEAGGFVCERNNAVIKALKKAIGDGQKKIAVLYAVGHMPDLGRRLQKEFDLVPSHVRWKTALSARIRELNVDYFPSLKSMVTALGWFVILLVQALDLAFHFLPWAILFYFLWRFIDSIFGVCETVFRVNLEKETGFNVVRYFFPRKW